MSRFKSLLKLLQGPFKCAVKDGLKIGKGVTVMSGCNFGSEPYLITLGDFVRISNDVLFITHDGGNWSFRHQEPYLGVNHFGKIVIDEYTFIGARAIILPGVHIGKHCVIGAGSVVVKDVPDYSVVAGVPSKIISDTQAYALKMKNKMPENWSPKEYKKNKKEYLIKTIPKP